MTDQEIIFSSQRSQTCTEEVLIDRIDDIHIQVPQKLEEVKESELSSLASKPQNVMNETIDEVTEENESVAQLENYASPGKLETSGSKTHSISQTPTFQSSRLV